MRRKPLDHMDCSIAKSLDVVGDPWTMLIIRDALLGVRRFEAFSSRLEIPRATLTARLDRLVECGVLQRVQYQEHPRRDEYRLTAKGHALRPVVVTLMQWGDEWARDDDPPTTLIDADTGETVVPGLVDLNTGIPLSDLRVRARGSVTRGIVRTGDSASL